MLREQLQDLFFEALQLTLRHARDEFIAGEFADRAISAIASARPPQTVPPQDETLLRQALEDLSCATSFTSRKSRDRVSKTIAAIRTRLGIQS